MMLAGRRMKIQCIEPHEVLEVPWQGNTTRLKFGKAAVFEICGDHGWFDTKRGCTGCAVEKKQAVG
jgi:hypothetical protein